MHGRHHHRSGFVPETASSERSTTRVQLEMPPQAMERLQRLKEKTEAASYAEVIRNALPADARREHPLDIGRQPDDALAVVAADDLAEHRRPVHPPHRIHDQPATRMRDAIAGQVLVRRVPAALDVGEPHAGAAVAAPPGGGGVDPVRRRAEVALVGLERRRRDRARVVGGRSDRRSRCQRDPGREGDVGHGVRLRRRTIQYFEPVAATHRRRRAAKTFRFSRPRFQLRLVARR